MVAVWLAWARSLEEIPAELAHKHPSYDENPRRYTNPVRKPHFKALRRVERRLSAVFTAADTPWVRPSKNYMGRAKAERVRELRRQGISPGVIAARLEISVASVHRIAPASMNSSEGSNRS